MNHVATIMNAITPYEARYKQREDMTTMMNMLFLTFFFAYMGYKLLMDYTKSQTQWDNRMKTLEEHMETIEENATYINNELVNSSEQIKELQREVREMREDMKCVVAHILGTQGMTQGPNIHEFYKYVKNNIFENINDQEVIDKIKSGIRN